MKISIITPTLNRPSIIKAWNSLENQTEKNFEWTIVYNGSPSDDIDRLKHISEHSSFPVKIEVEPTKGPSPCRLRGEQIAEGEYFAYLDDDDSFEPDAIEGWNKDILKNNSDVSVLHSLFFEFYLPFGKFKITQNDAAFIQSVGSTSEANLNIVFSIPFQRMLYKKNFVQKSGSWDVKIRDREDLDFAFRIFLLCPKVGITEFGSYNYKAVTGSEKYRDREFARTALLSLDKICNVSKGTFAEHLVREKIGAEAKSRWEKFSLMYPDIGQEYKGLAERLGYSCSETFFKRKIKRMLKYPFRKIPLFTALYYYWISKRG